MPFVLDASIAACWAFQDEEHPHADMALVRIRIEEAVVPGIWWFEVRNILIVNERRKRITESDTENFLRNLARLPIGIDHFSDEAGVLRLARAHRLSVYDASYLELAQRHGAPLATLDRDLRDAAEAEGVPLIGGRG